MLSRDYRGIIGGGALVLVGILATTHAMMSLDQGSLSRPGTGMFPAALGVILAFLGALTLVPALFKTGEKPKTDFRSLLIILAAILAFAILMRPFGMVPSIIAMTLIVTKASNTLSHMQAIMLAAALAIGASLIFHVMLSMQTTLFAWPW